MHKDKIVRASLGLVICFGLTIATKPVGAYDSATDDNLRRSRDALLDQEAHLKDQANRIAQDIDNLQRQLASVNDYLRDTEHALDDVDRSLRSE